jgi:hypothetical protein
MMAKNKDAPLSSVHSLGERLVSGVLLQFFEITEKFPAGSGVPPFCWWIWIPFPPREKCAFPMMVPSPVQSLSFILAQGMSTFSNRLIRPNNTIAMTEIQNKAPTIAPVSR